LKVPEKYIFFFAAATAAVRNVQRKLKSVEIAELREIIYANVYGNVSVKGINNIHDKSEHADGKRMFWIFEYTAALIVYKMKWTIRAMHNNEVEDTNIVDKSSICIPNVLHYENNRYKNSIRYEKKLTRIV